MKKLTLILVFLLITIPCKADIIYVNDNAAGSNDGSSWANAYNYLQDALADANSIGVPTEIRVARGIYKPDQGIAVIPADRTATFRLLNNVTIKGGYAGSGRIPPDRRDVQKYKTVLTGDLLGNDVEITDPCELLSEPTRSENSYHVVTAYRNDNSAVLDGFIITGGNANGDFIPLYWGGGIYNENPPTPDWECTTAGPTITNCRIIKNSAASEGGGMYNRYSCQPQLTNCVFIENMASWGGGGIKNDTSNPNIINCTFENNFAGDSYHSDGGGLDNEESSPTFIKCIFTGNSADYGGAVGNWMGDNNPIFMNCLFSENSAQYGGAMWYANHFFPSNPTLINCTIVNNSADYGNALACTPGSFDKPPSNLDLTNCILWNDANEIFNIDGSTITISYSDIQAGWPGEGNIDTDPCFVDVDNGDYYLLSTSPCINTGDPNYIPEPDETDLNGLPRILDGRIDMGVYEFIPLPDSIEVEMKLTPQTLNCKSKGKWLKAHITLPEGFYPEDVDTNTPPSAVFVDHFAIVIDSQNMNVFTNDQGLVEIEILFNRESFKYLCDYTIDEIDIRISSSLITGRNFYASGTIKIKNKQ